jgi:hypothetical protein
MFIAVGVLVMGLSLSSIIKTVLSFSNQMNSLNKNKTQFLP